MRVTLTLLLTLSLLVACGQSDGPADMDLERVLAAHTDAVGGARAIEDVIALEVELRIEEPTFSVTGFYAATRDGRMRVDIFADNQRVFTEAYDGKSGWQLAQDHSSASDMSAEGEVAVIHGIHNNIFGLHELAALGYNLTLLGRESVDDTDYWMVDSVSADGFLKRYYINTETFLIERTREESALHPDMDAETKRFETLHFDYQEVSGRLFSFGDKKTDTESSDVVQSTTVVRLAVNPEIDFTIFDRPLN